MALIEIDGLPFLKMHGDGFHGELLNNQMVITNMEVSIVMGYITVKLLVITHIDYIYNDWYKSPILARI